MFLKGDKYGSPVLPSSIPKSTFSSLISSLNAKNCDTAILSKWYTTDSNNLSSVNIDLRPVSEIYPGILCDDQEEHLVVQERWEEEYAQLVALISDGLDGLNEDEKRDVRIISSLQSDLETLKDSDLSRVIAVRREFSDDKVSEDVPAYVTDFLSRLPSENIKTYSVAGPRPSDDDDQPPAYSQYLQTFGDELCLLIAHLILENAKQHLTKRDSLAQELAAQERYMMQLADRFYGREALVAEIEKLFVETGKPAF
ncbi:hypothetical protein HK096_001994, partial [Nowakowskiella sp. JEL0078]